MKLLVVTQVLDTNDLYLGFFHRWVEELATKFERIEVICLKEGQHTLPANVRVHSLGKEKGKQSPFVYAFRFLKLVWKLRKDYDAVFVHMNQEYLLIAGLLWEVLNKPAYLWRNHYAGSWLTDLAASFCRKVFYTSKHSYTAKYKRAVRMPVGVDTRRFGLNPSVPRIPHSILFFGRMMPSKRPGLVVDALIELSKRGVEFSATFAGSTPPGEEQFLAALKQRVADTHMDSLITFLPDIDNVRAAALYQAHQLYVNAGRSGMLDKTIFEAAASGCTVIAASDDWKEFAGDEYWFDGTSEGLCLSLQRTLFESGAAPTDRVVSMQSLDRLGEKIATEIC